MATEDLPKGAMVTDMDALNTMVYSHERYPHIMATLTHSNGKNNAGMKALIAEIIPLVSYPIWRQVSTCDMTPPGSINVIYPKRCPECETQFRSNFDQEHHKPLLYKEAFSTAKAQRITTGYVQSISADLEYLREKIVKNGDTIVNRWKKKSQEKRKAILVQALPQMPVKPYFIVWFCKEIEFRDKAAEYREGFLLPWLSVETLMKDQYKFLALLHARTQFSPEQWIKFDMTQTNVGWYQGLFDVSYANCCVVMHGDKYGKYASWDTEKAHQLDLCAFPRAKLILEAQALLMGFLRSAVEDLLQDLPAESLSTKWNLLAGGGFNGSQSVESWSAYTNKPYSSPVFDFEYLYGIAVSKLAEAKDELWLLQTDPAYNQYLQRQNSEGNVWNVKEEKQSSRDTILPMTVWTGRLDNIRMWECMAEEMDHAKSLYSKFGDSIHPGECLPADFNFAMACLEQFLRLKVQGRAIHLQQLIVQLPAFEHWFDLFPHGRGEAGAIPKFTADEYGLNCCYKKDPLFWCLWSLCGNFEKDETASRADLFTFLEDWLSKDSAASKSNSSRIDGRLLDELSSLAAMHEILSAVRFFRPTYTPIDIQEAIKKSQDRNSWRTVTNFHLDVNYKHPEKLEKDLSVLWADFEDKPFPKGHRDEKWLEKADATRRASAAFWSKTREIQKSYMEEKKYANRCSEDHKRTMLGYLSYDQAPEYLAEVEAERKEVLVKLAAKVSKKKALANADDEFGTFSQLASGIAEENPSSLKSRRRKTKVKKRGESSDPGEDSSSASQDLATLTIADIVGNGPVLSAAKVPVTSESVRVLSRMFPATVEEREAKALDWTRFVTAMQDAGFLASSSSGSGVSFTNGTGRIVFHRHHPDDKIPQMWLQAWGKRMRKWFGWERETLVVREKDVDMPK